MSKKIIIKLGGSLISKSEEQLIDFDYLRIFKQVINEFVSKDYKFIVSIGGGYITRKYQNLLKDSGVNQDIDLDWIGIATLNVNAEAVRALFADIAHPEVYRYKDFETQKVEFDEPVMICAAHEPGHSSDMDAVLAAQFSGATEIYRLTNVDAIYSDNPKENPQAKKFDKLTWNEYFQIIGDVQFTPGAHFPIDPVASKKAMELGLSVLVMDGTNMDNFKSALNSQEFTGTKVGI